MTVTKKNELKVAGRAEFQSMAQDMEEWLSRLIEHEEVNNLNEEAGDLYNLQMSCASNND